MSDYMTSESGMPLQIINFCFFAGPTKKSSDIVEVLEERGLPVLLVESAGDEKGHYHFQIGRNEAADFEQMQDLLVDIVLETKVEQVTLIARRINYCDGAYSCSAALTNRDGVYLSEWEREAPAREKLGASPLTRNQLGASRTLLSKRIPKVMQIPADPSIVRKIKESLDNTIPNEVTQGVIKRILHEARLPEGDRVDYDKFTLILSQAANLPIRLTHALCQNAIRMPGQHMEWIEYLENAKYDPSTSRDLSANPGFQRLVRDCIKSHGREEATMHDAQCAYHAMLTTVMDLGTQSVKEDFSTEWHARIGEVLWSCKNVLQKTNEKKNLSVIGDFYAQLPPYMVLEICNNFIDIYESYGEDKEKIPFDLSNADQIATEPFHVNRKGTLHGMRWRRMSSPQHFEYAHKTDLTLHKYAWIRAADLNSDDIDFQAFGVLGNTQNNHFLERSTHDYALQAWMIGLGPNPWHVEPMGIVILERDNTKDEELRWKLFSVKSRMGGASFPDSAFKENLVQSLTAVLCSELTFELAWKNESTSLTRAVLSTPDLVEGDDEHDQIATNLAMHFISMMGNHEDVEIVFEGFPVGFENECAKELEKLQPPEESEDEYHSSLMVIKHAHERSWGIVATESGDYPRYLQVPEPEDNRHYRKAMRILGAYKTKFDMDGKDLEAIVRGVTSIEKESDTNETLAYLQAAMTIWGQVVFAGYRTIEETGITIISTPPGTTAFNIVNTAIDGRKIGTYDHRYNACDIEEMMARKPRPGDQK